MTEKLAQYKFGDFLPADPVYAGGMRIEFTPPTCPDCGVDYMPVLSLEERAVIINYQHVCPPEPER
jgi:hypothetical protein